MSAGRAMAGFVAVAVPIAFVIYAFIATGIMALRKPPDKDTDIKDITPKPQRPLPRKLRNRKRR